jgi:transcription elongation factor GreA
MSEAKEYLTQEKYEELTKELHMLIHQKRKEVAEHLEYAKSLGDLSENAEYHEARDEQAHTEARIAQLEHMLKHAEIVRPQKGDTVVAGSTVAVTKTGSKEQHKFLLVGSEEADMATGKLSYQSPLGRMLMGKKNGDSFELETPKGVVVYKIVDLK